MPLSHPDNLLSSDSKLQKGHRAHSMAIFIVKSNVPQANFNTYE